MNTVRIQRREFTARAASALVAFTASGFSAHSATAQGTEASPTVVDAFTAQLKLETDFAVCRSPRLLDGKKLGWDDEIDWSSPGISSFFALANISPGLLSAAVNVWATSRGRATK